MISEDEFETVDAELLPSNQLQVFVKESGLEGSKAQFLVDSFEGHFKMSAEWAKKANKIVVTDASQTVLMEEARTARLFLRSKRLEIEKARVELKENALKEGRAIDRVATFLKNAIIPTEEHLARQEDFVKLKKEAEDARILQEAYDRQEQEKIEQEREAVAKQNRMLEENKKLQAEADALEHKLHEQEKEKQRELEKIRKENQAKVDEANKKALEAQQELIKKKQEEMKAEAEIQRQALILKQGSDLIKLQKVHNDLMNIDWPEMTGVAEKALRLSAMDNVHQGIMRIEKYLKTKVTEEEI